MKFKYLKKVKIALIGAVLLFFASALILFPERYISCCLKGILTWAQCVLPSLFPFMVVTMIFIKTGIAQSAAKPFSYAAGKLNLPPAAPPLFIMSVCSGYPAGSRLIDEYRSCGIISGTDVKKLALLCSTSGPLFILGSVGYKMFGDKGAGLQLLIAHVLSVVAVSLIYSLKASPSVGQRKILNGKSDNILYDCFYSSVIAVIIAGGFISFFFTLAQIIADFNLLYPLELLLSPFMGEEGAEALCYGLIEATGGCARISAQGSSLALPAAGFMITFGGASILAQQLCYLTKSGVKASFFIGFKFLQAMVCFLVLLLFSLL